MKKQLLNQQFSMLKSRAVFVRLFYAGKYRIMGIGQYPQRS
jgi:hypothetical protein